MRGSWDLGLDYSKMYKLLLKRIKSHFKRKGLRHYTYANYFVNPAKEWIKD